MDEAIVDAGLEASEPIEVPTDSAPVESATTEAPVEAAEADTATPAQTSAPYRAVSEDGKRLEEKARATIEELRANGKPELAKAFRDAIFEADRFRRALPGGLKEVQELRQTVQDLGGPEGIQGMQAEFQGWRDFDQQYMAADPKALEFMLSTPESQDAFIKLAPMAMNKFEELHPEAYASYLCQRIVGDAVANDVPVAMKLAQHFLSIGDAAKANEQFERIVNWFQGLDATARKPVVPKEAPKPTGEDPRVKELEQRDATRTREDWKSESAKIHTQIYTDELTRLSAGRKLSSAERIAIQHEVQTKFDQAISAEKGKIDQYFNVRDKDGYLKLAKSMGETHLRRIIAKVYGDIVPAKPGPKPQPQQNGDVRTPTPKPTDGFQFVQETPRSNLIDWDNPFNSAQNVRQGKAILTDGRKVTWRK